MDIGDVCYRVFIIFFVWLIIYEHDLYLRKVILDAFWTIIVSIVYITRSQINRDQRDQLLHLETESKTGIFGVSILRPGPRLKFSESQFRDRVRDWSFQSLNFETESETGINLKTQSKTKNFES